MAIAKVQGVNGSGTTLTLNGCSAGNFLSLQSSWFNTSSSHTEATPTDSAGTYSVGLAPAGVLFSINNTTGTGCFYMENISAGTHVTTPEAVSSRNRTMTEWSGVATASSKDVTASHNTADTNHQSENTGTTSATAQADELSLICLSLAASTGSANVGFTDPVSNYTTLQKVSNDLSDIATFHAYRVLSATGTQSATFNWTDTDPDQSSQGQIVTFKAAAGGAAAQPNYLTLLGVGA